jgi:hypothetical protein
VTSSGGGLRPQHVVSALAVGAVAGFWAAALVALGLLAIIGLAGSPVPPAGIDTGPATIGAAIGAVLGGLFYVNVIAWLPRPLTLRSVVFAALAGPLVGGIGATAHLAPGARRFSEAVPWIVAFSIGTALATPIMVRVTLFLTVRSTSSLVALPLTHSALLVLVLIAGPFRDPATALNIAAQAPALVTVAALAIVVLAIASWTVALQSSEQRPGWFRNFGWLLGGTVGLAGVAMILAAAGG